jgi:hypothetical protein
MAQLHIRYAGQYPASIKKERVSGRKAAGDIDFVITGLEPVIQAGWPGQARP